MNQYMVGIFILMKNFGIFFNKSNLCTRKTVVPYLALQSFCFCHIFTTYSCIYYSNTSFLSVFSIKTEPTDKAKSSMTALGALELELSYFSYPDSS